jgi:NAD(P)H-dependent FMN reductase
MTKALVFAASTRAGSLNRLLALAAADHLRQAGIEVTIADLRDYPMPFYDGDLEAESGLPERARAFRSLIAAHDVLVIASPEYNGSFPALLKNVVDWSSRPAAPGDRPAAVFRGKTAALLSASPGPGGGRRGLRHLRELLQMIGVTVLPVEVALARAHEAFDAAGELARPEDREALAGLGDLLTLTPAV